MKRLISAALAFSLLGTSVAVADPWGRHGGWGGRGHYDRGYRHGDNGAGLAIGLGVGLFALAAIAASQHHDEDRYDRGYGAYDNGYGYNNGYGRGYGGYRGGYNDYRGGYGY